MQYLPVILCACLLASCASKPPPSVIIAPETTIRAVDTQPIEDTTRKVEEASEKVSTATRKAAEATARAATAAEKTEVLITQLDIVEESREIIIDSWRGVYSELEITKRAMSEALEESDGLRGIVKSLVSETSTLKASAVANKVQADTLRAENRTLRAQAKAGNEARDQLLTLRATSKTTITSLRGWLWKSAIANAILSVALAGAAYLLFKP